MTAFCVVYAADRNFRTRCDALLRDAGVRVRLASRQTELFKSIRDGDVQLVLVDATDADRDVVHAVTDSVPIMQRAPGESIEMIVARALHVLVRASSV